MKKRTSRRKTYFKYKKTQKRRKQRGGNCGCNSNPLFGSVPVIRGGGMGLNPYTLPPNTIPMNTYNNDPISMTTTERISGGKSRKYQRKQTPYYRRQKMQGGDPLLGSAYNPVSSFGTTSGIPFSSNTLLGISNQVPANGADLSFFGKHNPPLV